MKQKESTTEKPDYETVIIGAGIHGLSTAWHLAQQLKAKGTGDGSDIVVLDKTAIAAGASGIACGVVRNNYFQPAMRELMAHSVDVWEENASDFGYHAVGYMQISPESMHDDVAQIAKEQKAIDYAAHNPGHAVRLAFRKAVLFLSPVPGFASRKGWVAEAVCATFWLLLLVGCVGGLRIREWNALGLIVTAGPLILFLLVHMVFVGSVRYRLPLEFPLAVLGAIGWHSLAPTRGQQSRTTGSGPVTEQSL